MKLIIVESPTKAKTITKFLGKKFTVKSSFGHVRDLPKSSMGVDIENDFVPKYVIPSKARDRVAELKKLGKRSDEIILATDEDREGEAISWHLAHILDLKAEEIKRIVFHEITESAIKKALENPRQIDLNLVDAQQARRILDRLVGYELSPFLWKKIRRGLSAGRVQSMALRFIVEREREIEKFVSEEYWLISARLKKEKDSEANSFETQLAQKNEEKIENTVTLKLFAGDYKTRKSIIKDKKTADEISKDLGSCQLHVSDITRKESLRMPPAPFTTSTLQQSAISQLGFSAKQTMVLAQKLYEEGHITYMRTDSLNLSLESLLSAKKFIENEFGKEYSLESPRYFQNKSKGAQEAHEAIRPTFPEKNPEELKGSLENNHYRLYKLIWNRMIACQMKPAIFDSVKVEIEARGKNNYILQANGSTLKFEGYLKVYADKRSKEENILPEMKKGDPLDIVSVNPEQKSTTPPPRYNEATLVKILEENGIGRPSTYAPTISTIIERKYVDKNEEKRLFPLEVGTLVNDILVKHFPEIVDPKFTATIEEEFDEIAEGKKEWVPMIREFYDPFHKNLEAKNKEVKREDFHEKIDKKCPDCGGDLIMKFGRFGKFIACSNYPSCKYTEKTAEEKKEDEKHKGEACEVCGAPMIVKRGKFGSFLGCSNYPECKNIKRIEKKLGVQCPKCNIGEIVERKSKKGRLFFGCNTYPKCDFALWNKPTGEKCPKCKALLTFAAKGKFKCSNKECDFEK